MSDWVEYFVTQQRLAESAEKWFVRNYMIGGKTMQKTKKSFLILSLITLCITIFAHTGDAFAAISEQAATSLALDAIKSEYNKTDDEMAEYVFAEATFRQSHDETGDEWFVIFAGIADHPEFSNDTYAVYLTPDGAVKQIKPPTIRNSINAAFRDLSAGRGLFVTWTIDEKYEFHQSFSQKISEWRETDHPLQEGEVASQILHLASIDFRKPEKGDIDFSSAKLYATNALIAQEGEVDFNKYDNVCSSFIALPTGKTIWRIFFIPTVRRDIDCGYRVDIDSKSGEPIEVMHQYAYDSDWASWYE